MAIEEFYAAIGGDLPGVRSRLLSDDRVQKFVGIFLDDPTFATLQQGVQAKDHAEAFRAAHTMKGLASNLGFDRLQQASSELTEALRPNDAGEPTDPAAVEGLMEAVEAAYGQIADAMPLIQP